MENTIIIQPRRKSMLAAILLVFFFGPLGMLYATISGAIKMILLPIAVYIITFVFLLNDPFLFVNPIIWLAYVLASIIYYISCYVWTVRAINEFNERSEQEALDKARGVSEKKNKVEVKNENLNQYVNPKPIVYGPPGPLIDLRCGEDIAYVCTMIFFITVAIYAWFTKN